MIDKKIKRGGGGGGWKQEKAKRKKYFKQLISFYIINTVKNNRQILQFCAIIKHVIQTTFIIMNAMSF